MRNFRTAAVATATALAVATTGFAPANAADAKSGTTESTTTSPAQDQARALLKDAGLTTEEINYVLKDYDEADYAKFVEYFGAEEHKDELKKFVDFVVSQSPNAVQTVKNETRGSQFDVLFAGFNRGTDRVSNKHLDGIKGDSKDATLKDVIDALSADNPYAAVGNITEGDRAVHKQDMLGSSTDVTNVPQWARIWMQGLSIAGIGAIIGLIIAGVNYASYNGWIQLPSL